jgi:hypothetical protein
MHFGTIVNMDGLVAQFGIFGIENVAGSGVVKHRPPTPSGEHGLDMLQDVLNGIELQLRCEFVGAKRSAKEATYSKTARSALLMPSVFTWVYASRMEPAVCEGCREHRTRTKGARPMVTFNPECHDCHLGFGTKKAC